MASEFNFEEIRNLIKGKEALIHLRTNNGIQEHENFKKVHRLVISFKEERSVNEFIAILIKKEEIENIAEDFKAKLFHTLSSENAIVSNHIFVDRDCSLLHCERKDIRDNNEARRLYLELSNDFCVFLITPRGVHYFVDGNDIGEAIFFTSDTLNSYNELKDIDKIWEVFEDYRKHLKLDNTYRKFFVSMSGKMSLSAHLQLRPENVSNLEYNKTLKKHAETHPHLLNNKPEDNFREDLRHFLEMKLKAKLLGREFIMENFKRLDIFIQDNFGDLYLIEVKWVGLSIHADGQKFGTPYVEKDINPAAIVQSVGYIKQLAEEGKQIKIGYLAVFDARFDDLPDTVASFDQTIINENDEKYYFRFKRIPDFRVINYHPR